MVTNYIYKYAGCWDGSWHTKVPKVWNGKSYCQHLSQVRAEYCEYEYLTSVEMKLIECYCFRRFADVASGNQMVS